jgi:peptidyl-prolyl cis-trans isomerase SurA
MREFRMWAAAAAFMAAATGTAQAQLVEGVAASVNDDIVSTYDVRQRALLLLASAGIDASAENMQRARPRALQDLVNERLQIQEARKYEITVTSDSIDRAIADIARSNRMTAEQFQGQLARAGIGMATLRRQIEAETAWRRLINGRYGSRVRISDGRVRETLARIASSATRTQYLASEIRLCASSDREFAEAEATAVRLLQEMQRGAPFPLVARQFSCAPSAAANGDLGWMVAGELRPELQTALDRLTPGQVSTPFRTEDGVYIVALREKREGAASASVERVNLRQITAPAASQGALQTARRRVQSCTALERAVAGVQGVNIVDLGDANVPDLSDQVRTQINGVAAGQTSQVAVSGEQASMLVVCARETNTTGLPSRDEIENRLFEQELAMLAERYLRNLRRDATVAIRQ